MPRQARGTGVQDRCWVRPACATGPQQRMTKQADSEGKFIAARGGIERRKQGGERKGVHGSVQVGSSQPGATQGLRRQCHSRSYGRSKQAGRKFVH